VTAINCRIDDATDERAVLEKAGLASSDASAWLAAFPELRNDFSTDNRACSNFWDLGQELRTQLPRRPARNPNHAAASALMLRKERDLRERFLNLHVEGLYARLTGSRSKFLRVEDLMPAAATLVPGLTPGTEALAAERALPLKDKDGIEIDHTRSAAATCATLCFCHARKHSNCFRAWTGRGRSIWVPPM
jgi:hypothetical protein